MKYIITIYDKSEKVLKVLEVECDTKKIAEFAAIGLMAGINNSFKYSVKVKI